MSLSTFFTKAAATKTVRLATVPALAVAGVALAAGPALADEGGHGHAARIVTTHAVVEHGAVTVSGFYACARPGRSEELRVTVRGEDRWNRAEATREVRVDCSDDAHAWRLTLVADRHEHFAPGVVHVDARLGGWRGHGTSSSTTLFARGV